MFSVSKNLSQLKSQEIYKVYSNAYGSRLVLHLGLYIVLQCVYPLNDFMSLGYYRFYIVAVYQDISGRLCVSAVGRNPGMVDGRRLNYLDPNLDRHYLHTACYKKCTYKIHEQCS